MSRSAASFAPNRQEPPESPEPAERILARRSRKRSSRPGQNATDMFALTASQREEEQEEEEEDVPMSEQFDIWDPINADKKPPKATKKPPKPMITYQSNWRKQQIALSASKSASEDPVPSAAPKTPTLGPQDAPAMPPPPKPARKQPPGTPGRTLASRVHPSGLFKPPTFTTGSAYAKPRFRGASTSVSTPAATQTQTPAPVNLTTRVAGKTLTSDQEEEDDEQFAAQLTQHSQRPAQEAESDDDAEKAEDVPAVGGQWPILDYNTAKTRTKYDEQLQRSRFALALQIISEDKRHDILSMRRPLLKRETDEMRATLEILYTMDDKVIKSLNARTIFTDFKDRGFREALPIQKALLVQAKGQAPASDEEAPRPGLYCHAHVNTISREAPSMGEYKVILQYLERYSQGVEQTMRIRKDVKKNRNRFDNPWDFMENQDNNLRKIHADNLTLVRAIDQMEKTGLNKAGLPKNPKREKEWWRSKHHGWGRRRYLETDADEASRVAFVNNLRETLKLIPYAHRNDPLRFAIFEVGWSIKPFERMSAHKVHSSSLQLMNLIDAITRYLTEQKILTVNPPGSTYEMKGMLLYECWEADQAFQGEHILTRMTHAYTWDNGMNGAVAGFSNESALQASAKVYRQMQANQKWGEIDRRMKSDAKALADEEQLAGAQDQLDSIQRKLGPAQKKASETAQKKLDQEKTRDASEEELSQELQGLVELHNGTTQEIYNMRLLEDFIERLDREVQQFKSHCDRLREYGREIERAAESRPGSRMDID